MLIFPVPPRLHGDRLTAELELAGFDVVVTLDGDDLWVSGEDATAANQAAIQRVVVAHTGETPPEEIEEREMAETAAEATAALAALVERAEIVASDPANERFTDEEVHLILANVVLRSAGRP